MTVNMKNITINFQYSSTLGLLLSICLQTLQFSCYKRKRECLVINTRPIFAAAMEGWPCSVLQHLAMDIHNMLYSV